MSRSDRWVPIDKNIVQEFKYIDRPFSRVEALVSFSIDFDCKCQWTINGYAKQWQWSRNKVRKFISDIISKEGHTVDSKQTHYRHPIHKIDLCLQPDKDTQGTHEGQGMDTKNGKIRGTVEGQLTDSVGTGEGQQELNNDGVQPLAKDTEKTVEGQSGDSTKDTTNKTNTKTKKKNSATEPPVAPKTQPAYITRKGKKLIGEKLVAFETFWEEFGDKRGKAKAADAWLNIPGYTPALAKTISSAAKSFAGHRVTIKAANLTPVMAEGWLSGRRWEDDLPVAGQGQVSAPNCPSCDYFVRKSCKGNRPKCGSYRPHSTKA